MRNLLAAKPDMLYLESRAQPLSVSQLLEEVLVAMNDTPPEIAARVRRMLMARSGAERVLMSSQMFDSARAMMLASFPPGLTDLEIKGRFCQRLYGDEVQAEAFVEHLRSSRFGG